MRRASVLLSLILLMAWVIPTPGHSAGICHKRDECECIFSSKGLRDGRWQAATAAGSFVSSEGYVTVMHADEINMEIISHCDGKLEISWDDREAGRVDWELFRFSKDANALDPELALYEQVDAVLWADFLDVARELEELAKDNEIYMGATTYTVQGVVMPATMVLAYSGLPGRADERGWASITVRLGPFGGRSFWGRTGKVDLFWVAEFDEMVQRRREICSCDHVEFKLASYDLSIRLQQAIFDKTKGLKMRRTGYHGTLDTLIKPYTGEDKPFTEMMNERFDPSLPISMPSDGSPGNWPCVPASQIQNQTASDQVQYKVDFDKALPAEFEKLDVIDRRLTGEPPAPAVPDGDKPKGSTGAKTMSDTCEIIVEENPSSCPTHGAVLESYIAHEKHHQSTCKAGKVQSAKLKAALESTAKGESEMPGMTRDKAKAMLSEKPWVCLEYPQYMTNSHLAALDELQAYKAGRVSLEKYHKTYCSF